MAKKAGTRPAGKDAPTAGGVAKAMAENMAANQQDPNFEMEKARREGDAADKALREHGLHPDQRKKGVK